MLNLNKFILISFIGFFLASCKMNTYSERVDEFSGKKIATSEEYCSFNVGGDLCTKFTFIDNNAYMHLAYQADDWLFADKISIKNKNNNEIYVIEQDYSSWIRDVGYAGTIREEVRVFVDEKFFNFIKNSLGSDVIVRFHGKDFYDDIEFPVGSDPEHYQWAAFVEKYNTLNI